MDYTDFVVDRAQHMRPLEYDLSENFNELVRYLNDMGMLGNVPVGVTSESEIVSISDAYPAPPRALNVYGKSTQADTPTPDAPVPILSVDDLSLNVCGKNLFGAPTWAEISALELINGYRHWPIRLKPNTTYYVSNTEHDGYTSVGTSTYLLFSPSISNSPWVALAHSTNGSTSGTLTTDESGIIYLAANSNTTQAKYEAAINGVYTMLTEGSTATEYEPYIGITVPIDLQDHELRSLPDGTKDTLALTYLRPSTREGWGVYGAEMVQRTYSLIIPDTFSVGGITQLGDYVRGAWYTARPTVRSPQSGWCSNASYVVDAIGQYEHVYLSGSSPIFIAHGTDAEAIINAYAGAEIIYALATPVTTALDPIELPTLPAPNCTVWCDGGSATPTLVLEYVRDANATIAELSEAIADIVSD